MGHFFLSPAVVILLFLRVWNRRRTWRERISVAQFQIRFSQCRVCGKLSQIVNAIRRKRESPMSIRGRAAAYGADECDKKLENGWLSLP